MARFVIYSRSAPPLSVVTCPYFRDMFVNKSALLHQDSLYDWIDIEWKIFKFFCEIEVKLCYIYHKGNPFAQLMHDGGTAKNHKKYQAIGIQYIQPWKTECVNSLIEEVLRRRKGDVTADILLGTPESGDSSLIRKLTKMKHDPNSLSFQQVNIAFGFTRSTDGTAPAVAKLIRETFLQVFNIS